MITRLFRHLFSNQAAPPAKPDPLARAHSEVAELRKAVFDLFVEIEALRETLLKSPLGSGGKGSPYAIAYRKTAMLTHDATGPSGGQEKLMWKFYPHDREEREWRECLFMQRLGLSAEDLAKYKREAEAKEYYT